MNTFGRLVCLSGVDGVGKTTHARLLVAALRASGRPARYEWLRFSHYTSLGILALARVVGLTRYRTVGGVRYASWEFHRSRAVAALFPWTVWVDTALRYALAVHPRLRRAEWVVVDRFVPDILVDLMLAVGRCDLHRAPVGRAFARLIPPGARLVLLDADEAVLRARRPDVAHDPMLGVRRQLYLTLAQATGVPVVRANTGIEDVQARLRALVLAP